MKFPGWLCAKLTKYIPTHLPSLQKEEFLFLYYSCEFNAKFFLKCSPQVSSRGSLKEVLNKRKLFHFNTLDSGSFDCSPPPLDTDEQ